MHHIPSYDPKPLASEVVVRPADGLCHYGCGREATTKDHVIPRYRDGGVQPAPFPGARKRLGYPALTIPSCEECNGKRGSRPYPEWAHHRGVHILLIEETFREAVRRYYRYRRGTLPGEDARSAQDLGIDYINVEEGH